MRFQILGDLAVWDDAGVPVVVSGPVRRGLLAILVLHANEAVAADRLIDELWAEQPPATAAKALQVHIWRLRAALGGNGAGEGPLRTKGGGYVLRVARGELDLEVFERLLDEGRAALSDDRPQLARVALAEALSLWRGAPLGEFEGQPFARAAIDRLEQLRLEATEARIDGDLALGRHRVVVGELESLVAANPLREHPRAQLMRALYRCGRQADALAVYRQTRAHLSGELGLEPGGELRALEQSVLAQDPSLDLPARIEPEPAVIAAPVPGLLERQAEQRPRRASPAPRWLAAGGVLAVAAAAVAVIASAAGGPSGTSRVPANSVAVIDASSGRLVGDVPVGARPSQLSFDQGRLWVANLGDGTVSEIDPGARQVLRTLAVGTAAQTTVAGVAADSGALWTVDAAGVIRRVDLRDDTVHSASIGTPWRLGAGASGPDAAVVAEGSAWIIAGPSSVARLDLRSGRVTNDIAVGTYPVSLAAGYGSVWVTDNVDDTVSRIDASSGAVTQTIPVGRGASGIAAGGGGIWVADTVDNTVLRIDPATGAVTDTIAVAGGPRGVAFGAGAVWVADSRTGSLSRIDPSTRRVVATIKLGRSPEDVTVLGQSVFVSVQAGAATFTPQPGGLTVRIATQVDPLPSTDPALAANSGPFTAQLLYLTCATLLNYPDLPAPAGASLVPEVARSLPTVSADGRTYTFTLRHDYRFSPPSGAAVTPQAFVRALERTLNPQMASSGATDMLDIVGARAYATGHAAKLAGVSASGDQLTIRLVAPAPSFPTRIAEQFFCAIPPNTPIDPKGVEGIPTAGPYYIASHVPNQRLVLERNPNYVGRRPRAANTNDVSIGIAGARAAQQVETGAADYIPEVSPDVAASVLARYGPASTTARAGAQQYFEEPALAFHYLALNTRRPLFAQTALRRAVNYAIDRRALTAAASAGPVYSAQPTAQYLQPGMPGYEPAAIYPLGRPDLATAKRLARGHGGHGVIYTFTGTLGLQLAQIVKNDLHAIGLEMDIKQFGKPAMYTRLFNRNEPYDIALAGWVTDYPDPFGELNVLFDSTYIPPATPRPYDPTAYVNFSHFHNPNYDRRLRAAALLSGTSRTRAYGQLAVDLARDAAPAAAWGVNTTRNFFAARIGCETYQPIYGFDLATLCLRAKHAGP
ncbi:MAG: ABC transporter substrate-binding protein [Solirubrobacteraceae bacterium]